jgi:hypothetical protein
VAVWAVVFDGDEPRVDNGALHGRACLERGIAFSEDPAAAGRGARVALAWVATRGPEHPQEFTGAVAGEMWVDAGTATGFKRLADHTNGICAAARGKMDLGLLTTAQRKRLTALLSALAPEAWAATAPIVRLFLTAA